MWYLSIGSGHQVVAEAIAEALRCRRHVDVICRDPVAERHGRLTNLMNLGNSLSAVMFSRLYTRVWNGGQAGLMTKWIAAHGPIANGIRSAIDAARPSRIVCTHGMPAWVAAQYLRRGARPQLVGVVSDFGAHTYWPNPLIDRYCVPADEIRLDLIERGIDPQIIHVTGVPVRTYPRSVKLAERSSSARPRVLIVIGGRRAGPYRRAARLVAVALPQIDRCDLPIDITIVTGANQWAYRQLSELRLRLRHPIELLGLVNDVPRRLTEADILIGKTGGAITAEALATGTPFIALTPGPGQETANADFLRRHQLDLICSRPEELVKALAQLATDPEHLHAFQQRIQAHGRPDAAEAVARVVLNEFDS